MRFPWDESYFERTPTCFSQHWFYNRMHTVSVDILHSLGEEITSRGLWILPWRVHFCTFSQWENISLLIPIALTWLIHGKTSTVGIEAPGSAERLRNSSWQRIFQFQVWTIMGKSLRTAQTADCSDTSGPPCALLVVYPERFPQHAVWALPLYASFMYATFM